MLLNGAVFQNYDGLYCDESGRVQWVNSHVLITKLVCILYLLDLDRLEDKLGDIPTSGNGFTVAFKPFQVRSFLVYF